MELTPWTNCRAHDNKATCDWTGNYEGDPDKSGTRHGMLEVELQGDPLTGTVHEEEVPFLFHIYFLAGVKISAEVLMRFLM